MVRVLSLQKRRWDVTAVVELQNGENCCPLTDFLASLPAKYHGSRAGLIKMIEEVAAAEHGPQLLNTKQCHLVDERESIWEFIKGDLRVLWFYAKGADKVIICSHGFVKDSQKTKAKDKKKAINLKKQYEKDRKLEFVKPEDEE